MKKWQPCIITWKDAVTYHDPGNSTTDEFPVVERRSCGFFLKKNATGDVTICMEDDRKSADGESDCQTVTTILSGMVVEITELQPHRRKITPRKKRMR